VLVLSEKSIAAAGALLIAIGFVLALARWHKKQAFDFHAALIVIGSWVISFLVMWLLLISWVNVGVGTSLLFAIVLFPIPAYAIAFGTLVACTWSLVGTRWVSNILTALTILSLVNLVIVAIVGIQI
jgi:hypothetical protein